MDMLFYFLWPDGHVLFYIIMLTLNSESGNPNFGQFKGHNLEVYEGIWLVIELGRDIMLTNIFTKFNKDRMKTL